MQITYLLLLFPLLPTLLAQSSHPSPTPVRRSPHPLPTSLSEITDPELLAALASHKSSTATRSRRRSSKIHGLGHEADKLPMSNAERLQIGLPLKPPGLKVREENRTALEEFEEEEDDLM